MKQRDVFLQSEGDAWLERNTGRPDWRFNPQQDALLTEIARLAPAPLGPKPVRLLEIGCGNGERLAWLQEQRGFDCYGIDPSPRAVASARQRGVEAQSGTAEALPFADAAFDVVTFGFCLYLCDREDLFRIAAEADRVLKNPGWLLVRDFYARQSSLRPYHHHSGVFSHKMDYAKLFTWHPAYSLCSHRLEHHATGEHTDDTQQWVATSVLRKHLEPLPVTRDGE
jgi:ubiquinone/menaquinone biosynthesis C-methylase UbiE